MQLIIAQYVRMSSPARHIYEFGPFSLDVERRLMLKAAQVVPLTSKAFDTLLALVENHARVVEKEELLRRIWPDAIVEERNLAVNISILRKLLGESPESHEYIVTIPGRGYRFVAPLRQRDSQQAAAQISEAACTTPRTENAGGAATEAHPAIRPGRKWKPVLLGAGWSAALIAGFALGRYFTVPTPRPPMRFSAITNFSGVEAQPAFSPDGRSVAFASNRGGQFDIWVGLVSGGSLVRITNDPNVEARPRWSPDGSRLLYARLNESGLWDTWIVPALGGSARKLIISAADATWSPDGRSIAYANVITGSIWMCEAGGHDPRPLTSPEAQVRHRQPAFSRNGRSLAFVRLIASGGPYGELAVTEVGSGGWRPLTDEGWFVGSPAWSPDGRFVYFASSRGGTVNIWKVDTKGGPPEQITVGQGADADLDVSADGRRIVFSSYRSNVNLEEIVLGGGGPVRRWLTEDATHSELAPVYSRDGKHIAYFTNRRGAESEGIWVVESDGSKPIQLIQDERLNVYPRWSGDGSSLVYSSRPTGAGASRLWGAPELRIVLLPGGPPQKVPFPVADPFGDVSRQDQFLYRGAKGLVEIFDSKTNQVQTLKDVRGLYLRWCPDGSRLAAMVHSREQNDAAAGIWLYDLGGKQQQVFHGWAAYYAWAGADQLLILEGSPDLNATLWRVGLDGSVKVKIGSIPLIYSYYYNIPVSRFDAHPDGKRIVAEAIELHQADLSMIENIR